MVCLCMFVKYPIGLDWSGEEGGWMAECFMVTMVMNESSHALVHFVLK